VVFLVISGPAKSTWQRTLSSEDKKSWNKIVSVYRRQYGVHLDPRTAYQRCHEPQYAQFGSAQGLLDSMHDYQRMAPTKLTDEVLESILWNKAPIGLQKEITVGSVQELFHKLLRAEAAVQERNRRGKDREATSQPRRAITENKLNRPPVETLGTTQKDQTKETVARQGGEMSLKYAKGFKCQESSS